MGGWRRRFGALATATAVAGLLVTGPAAGPAGADGNEAPGAPAAYRQISAGNATTCALVDGGDVRCWGWNSNGRLGQEPTLGNIGDGPNEMGSNVEPVDFGTGQTATAITVGEQHVCVVLATRAVKCWGGNFFGQLGLGDTNGRGDGFDELGDNLPVVALGTNRTATAVSAGLHHTARSSTTGP